MANISKKIKSEIDVGTKKEVIVEALGLIDKTIKNDLVVNATMEFLTLDTPTSSVIPKISGEHFNDVLDTYKSSPEDVKEKLKKGEISLKDAKDVADFN